MGAHTISGGRTGEQEAATVRARGYTLVVGRRYTTSKGDVQGNSMLSLYGGDCVLGSGSSCVRRKIREKDVLMGEL